MILTSSCLAFCLLAADQPRKPLFKDFMGLNVHTVLFKPELYKPTVKLLRDYHPVEWDLGSDPKPAAFPISQDKVNWQELYGGWKNAGYTIDACAMFESIEQSKWGDVSSTAHDYGLAFAKYFGPSSEHKLVESIEIGNEPTKFKEDSYRKMFEAMAKGVRKGDPNLKISTCAVNLGKGDEYAKDIACLAGLESLYDIISVHQYAFAEMWPTWRRSYPEDPNINYLKGLQKLIDWRDKNAKGKPIWLTEFGWDSSTKKPTGDWEKFQGNTDLEQAQYIVRSFLALSEMDIDRAYIFFFNDDDGASLHAASGITRGFHPKPSFYAVAHLQKTLGDYRFSRVVAKEGAVWAFEYSSPTSKDRIWAVWSPTGSKSKATVTLPDPKGEVVNAERMATSTAAPASVEVSKTKEGMIKLEADESPAFLTIR